MLMDTYLPNSDIYQGTVALNCFKSRTCPDFFPKNMFYLMSCLKLTFLNVTSFLPDSLFGSKKLYSSLSGVCKRTIRTLALVVTVQSKPDANLFKQIPENMH